MDKAQSGTSSSTPKEESSAPIDDEDGSPPTDNDAGSSPIDDEEGISTEVSVDASSPMPSEDKVSTIASDASSSPIDAEDGQSVIPDSIEDTQGRLIKPKSPNRFVRSYLFLTIMMMALAILGAVASFTSLGGEFFSKNFYFHFIIVIKLPISTGILAVIIGELVLMSQLLGRVNRVSLEGENVVLYKLLTKTRIRVRDVVEFRPRFFRIESRWIHLNSSQLHIITRTGSKYRIKVGYEELVELFKEFLGGSYKYFQKQIGYCARGHIEFSKQTHFLMLLRDLLALFVMMGTLSIITIVVSSMTPKPELPMMLALGIIAGVGTLLATYCLATSQIGTLLDAVSSSLNLVDELVHQFIQEESLDANVPKPRIFKYREYISYTLGMVGWGLSVISGFFIINFAMNNIGGSQNDTAHIVFWMAMLFSGVMTANREKSRFKQIPHLYPDRLLWDKRMKKIRYMETIDRYDATYSDNCPACKAKIKSKVVLSLEKSEYTITCPICLNPFQIKLAGSEDET